MTPNTRSLLKIIGWGLLALFLSVLALALDGQTLPMNPDHLDSQTLPMNLDGQTLPTNLDGQTLPMSTVVWGEIHGFLAGFLPGRYRKAASVATGAKWYLLAEYGRIGIVREWPAACRTNGGD